MAQQTAARIRGRVVGGKSDQGQDPQTHTIVGTDMPRDRLSFLFLNVGHFFDHLFMLIFATVAALRLAEEWGMSYAGLIPYATPGFVAFGICAIPAGWIADKWSREGMMIIFFLGIGASSIATALTGSPLEIALGLLAIGVFAAIYHPVGLAMVVHGRKKTGMPLAINGVFGRVASWLKISGQCLNTRFVVIAREPRSYRWLMIWNSRSAPVLSIGR